MKTEAILVAVLLASTASAQPRHHHKEVAQSDDTSDQDEEPGDGPEAKAVLPIKLDDLIEAAVQRAPDLARAKIDRPTAKESAAGARRDQAWVMTSHAEYNRSAVADHVEVPPFSVVAQDQVSGGIGLQKKLPTGGAMSVEADLTHSN